MRVARANEFRFRLNGEIMPEIFIQRRMDKPRVIAQRPNRNAENGHFYGSRVIQQSGFGIRRDSGLRLVIG
jgi:hypothetical protein